MQSLRAELWWCKQSGCVQKNLGKLFTSLVGWGGGSEGKAWSTTCEALEHQGQRKGPAGAQTQLSTALNVSVGEIVKSLFLWLMEGLSLLALRMSPCLLYISLQMS